MSNKPQKLDPRVVRTRELLRNALIHLIQEKGFDAVKVQDITEYATLNKATFYLHYRDKEDLLIRSIYQLLQELDAKIGLPNIPLSELTTPFLLKTITAMFEHFAQNADFYRVVFTKIGTPPVIAAIQNPVEAIVHRWLTKLQDAQTQALVDLDMITRYISGGCVSLLQGWLSQPEPRPPEYVAQQFLSLIVLGIFPSAGLPTPEMP